MFNKYMTLRALATMLPVPRLFALTEADLADLWEDYGELRSQIDKILVSIHLTAAAFLDDHLDELHQIQRPRWRSNAGPRLSARMVEAGLDLEAPLAVRSSCSIEDTATHSFAGIFTSCLNVRGLAAVQDAIEKVWRSSFARTAILERLRTGGLEVPAAMTVIVQEMVDAEWSGVAFTHDPVSGHDTPTMEAVRGLGELLVSGEQRGIEARVENGQIVTQQPIDGRLQAVLAEVARMLTTAAQQLKTPTDIEWAFDGKNVWLLQARPITTAKAVSHEGPIWNVVELYAAADGDLEQFRPLPDFAQYFRTKRKPLVDFATQAGVTVGGGLLIQANRDGWSEARVNEILLRFPQPAIVLDFSTRVRQQIISREQISHRLADLLGPSSRIFVVRGFVRGDAGIITQVMETEGEGVRVLCEWSSEGLLAINRGTAVTVTCFLSESGNDLHAKPDGNPMVGLSLAQLDTLHRVTVQAQQIFDNVQLEWVKDGEELYLIDFSPLNAFARESYVMDGLRVVSPGYAAGRPILVARNSELENISIAASVSLTSVPLPDELGEFVAELYEDIKRSTQPIILVSPRPYAALAALVPYVAGFVFEQASMLCHLSILLREHGVPGVESKALFLQAHQQGRIVIDAVAPVAA